MDADAIINSIAAKHGVGTQAQAQRSSSLYERFGVEKPKPVNELQTPESPYLQHGDSKILNFGKDVVKGLSDAGTGFASSLAKTALGASELALRSGAKSGVARLTGADDFLNRSADMAKATDENVYEKPFENQKATLAGKTGTIAGNIAPYMSSAGMVNPATANLPKFLQVLYRTAPDIAIAASQTGGDPKATAAAGITSAVSNALLPGSGAVAPKLFSKAGAENLVKETIPGYVSDVASGFAGQRGEDREGAKAFIPGAGTLLGAGISLAGSGIRGAKDIADNHAEKVATQKQISSDLEDSYPGSNQDLQKDVKTVTKRLDALDDLDRYQTLKKTLEKGRSRDIDIKRVLAETNVLDGAVDETGNITTKGAGGAIEQYTDQYINKNEDIVSRLLDKEGRSVSADLVKTRLKDAVRDSGLEGKALKNALSSVDDEIDGYMLRSDTEGVIPVSTLHDAKVDKYNHVNYMSDPASQTADKAIAKSLKELVEENTTSADVKAINGELSKHFSVVDYLEKLDNKKVAGGKLGKYFAKAIGAVIGSKGGPIGSLVTSEAAGKLQGKIMSGTLDGKTSIPPVEGQAITNAKEVLDQPPLQLQSGHKDIIDMVDAVDDGLTDPAYSKLYHEDPQGFVDEMKGSISDRLKNTSPVEAKMIEAIPPESGFHKFVQSVKKILGADLPNKEGGFIKTRFTNDNNAPMVYDIQKNTDDITQFPYGEKVAPKVSASNLDINDAVPVKTMTSDASQAMESGNPTNMLSTNIPVKPEPAKDMYKYYKEAITSSDAMNIDKAIKSGDIQASDVYQGNTKVLTPEFAKGRIDDISMKLDSYEKGLGNIFRASVQDEPMTLNELIKRGKNILQDRHWGLSLEDYIPKTPTKIDELTKSVKEYIPLKAISDANKAREKFSTASSISGLKDKLIQ